MRQQYERDKQDDDFISIPYRFNETMPSIVIVCPSAIFQFLIGSMRQDSTGSVNKAKPFQFVIGSMRHKRHVARDAALILFQFLIGSMRRIVQIVEFIMIKHFNSL